MASGLANAPVPDVPRSVHAGVRLRFDDLVVLTIVSACALEASTKLLGVSDPIVQSLLVIAWTAAAARRLVAWRHGQGPARLDRLSQKLTVVACTAPLFVMQLLNPTSRDWSTSAPLSLPFWLHASGGLFIVISLLAPFCAQASRRLIDRSRGPERNGLSLGDVEFQARVIGFILLTGSPVVGAAVCAGMMLKHWTEPQGATSPVAAASAGITDDSPREMCRADGTLNLLPA
jgi:hypothetical protein